MSCLPASSLLAVRMHFTSVQCCVSMTWTNVCGQIQKHIQGSLNMGQREHRTVGECRSTSRSGAGNKLPHQSAISAEISSSKAFSCAGLQGGGPNVGFDVSSSESPLYSPHSTSSEGVCKGFHEDILSLELPWKWKTLCLQRKMVFLSGPFSTSMLVPGRVRTKYVRWSDAE